jgi:hypothetical protein
MEALYYFETSAYTNPATLCHIPDEKDPQQTAVDPPSSNADSSNADSFIGVKKNAIIWEHRTFEFKSRAECTVMADENRLLGLNT